MDLKDKLITTEKREISGPRSSNRFVYQHYWALYKLLEIFEANSDFMLIMEYFDDVIILDSSIDPQIIDFYQIKTNTKKNEYNVSTAVLTKKVKDSATGNYKDSYMEKLIDNYVRFRDETRSLNFVSNKTFNIELSTLDDSKDKDRISLNELSGDELQKIKDNICSKCSYKNCNEKCKDIVFFEVTDLSVHNYTDTVIGKLIQFINKHGGGTIKDFMSVYHTLISEIARINNLEKKVSSFEELVRRKSITKEKFSEYIEQLKLNSLMIQDWSEISNLLLGDGYKTIEISKIKKQWNKYRIDMISDLEKTLNIIREDIREILGNAPELSTYKEHIDYVHTVISEKDYYKSNLYDKNYYTAIILLELHYDED